MIEVRNLKKKYGEREALKGLSLSIKDGECYGLLGPNGAGKTTTISVLSSIFPPDSGEVEIGGFSLAKQAQEIKNIIGVVPQEIALYGDFSAVENLKFWGGLYKVPKKDLLKRAANLLNLFGLSERQNDKVKDYSGGMKRRINIAAALLHNPKVLFMDEPTVGIDPQSRNLIFEVIEKLHAEGLTIIYTTHYMEEAERLCDRIGIIDNGQIIAEDTLDELKNSSATQEAIVVSFENLTEEEGDKLAAFWPENKRLGFRIYFYSKNIRSDLVKIILECREVNAEVSNIELQKADLETIFLSLTGKKLRD